MLNKIIIENFKTIKDRKEIDLKNFTIISGANSSGKSSILQSILIISQSFSSRHEYNSIAINGSILRLGSIADITSHAHQDKPITIGFQYKNINKNNKNNLKFIEFSTTFGNSNSIPYSPDNEFHPSIENIYLKSLSDEGREEELFCKKENGSNNYLLNKFSFKEDAFLSNILPDYKIISCTSGSGIIPNSLNIEYNKAKQIYRNILSSIKNKSMIDADSLRITKENLSLEISEDFFKEIKFLLKHEAQEKIDQLKKSIDFSKLLREQIKKTSSNKKFSKEIFWNTLLSDFENKTLSIDLEYFITNNKIINWIDYINELKEDSKSKLNKILDEHKTTLEDLWSANFDTSTSKTKINSRLLSPISEALSSYFSRSIKYLGPLRTEPQAIYSSLGNSDSNNIGYKGEFTAAVLHINSQKTISYLSPSFSENHIVTFVEKQDKLINACIDWLNYLGVVSDYRTQDKGKLGYELEVKINENDDWQDLTHVGVGVSQVLPIVLMSLLSKPDDVLIFEQPELHLHPKVQSRICDLFLSLSQNNRQCLIETHSEYLINRLRLRIVQNTTNKILENTAIYFFNKEKDSSIIKEVLINEYGAILDWPEDFFDQSDNEISNILIEASKKSKQKQ